MALNLLSTVQGFFTPEAVRNTSSMLGESESSTRSVVQAAVPSLFGGLLHMTSSNEGASSLTKLISDGNFGSVTDNIGSVLTGGNETSTMMQTGQRLLGSIFGGKSTEVANSIAGQSGVRASSATAVLSMIAPLALGAITKRAGSGFNASSLTSLLKGESSSIVAAMPSGISNLLGLGGARTVNAGTQAYEMPRTGTYGGSSYSAQRTSAYSDTPAHVTTDSTTYRREAGLPRWIPLALLALLVAGLLWFLLRNRHPAEVASNAVNQTRSALSSIKLPGGVNLSVPEDSINYNLARYLADGNSPAPKNFVFDHLNFESSSTQLTSDSQQTVSDLASVLKAYPNAQVQLAGFTDNTGDPQANRQLSLARANAVRDQLVQQGVRSNQIATEGYGQERPIASNDTEQGKLQNRRLELTVTQK